MALNSIAGLELNLPADTDRSAAPAIHRPMGSRSSIPARPAAGSVMPTESAGFNATEMDGDLISPTEARILNLLFDGAGSAGFAFYGPPLPKFPALGNFIDMRG